MPLAFSEDYIAKLRRLFGLNMYETKLWLALLTQGSSSTARISEIADIPKSRAYDTLTSLENAGFVVRQLGKPITYKCVPPTELIDKLIQKAEQDLVMKKEKYEKLRNSEVIEDLNKLYVKGIPYVKEDEIATSYQGSEPAFFRIKNEIKSAKDEIVIVSTQSALMHTLRELERALKEAKSSGVNVKIHAPLQELKQELMDEISKLGKFTNLDLELGRFIIIDNNTVFLFTQNDKEIHPSNEIVIHLRGKYIADRFKQMVSAHSKQ